MLEWRAVPGFEGYLEVSSRGDVRSVDRYVHRSDTGTAVFQKGCVLIPVADRRGYPRIRTSINRVKRSLRVHRMVALAFIPNPEGKPQVNHLDGNKQNNAVDNLEWATNAENQRHAGSKGLKPGTKGADSVRFKGAIAVFDVAGKQVDVLTGNADMAAKGFDFRLVSACLCGKRKTHRGFSFGRITQ